MKILFTILMSLTLFSTTGCSTAAIGDGISEKEINAEAARAFAEIKSKSKISQNKEYNDMVRRVADRIALNSGEKFDWEYVVIESNEVNAWCMPGGKIAVYTGIMPVLKTEAALAAVLGHEVAHATLRHGMERYARAKKNNYWGLIAASASIIGGQVLCKTENCRKMATLGGYAAGFAITFLDRKFSREDESSADKAGQIFMAKAGYDPAESLELWSRMAAGQKGAAPPEFLSTHPSDQTRRSKLKAWLPEAQVEYAKASKQFGLGQQIK